MGIFDVDRAARFVGERLDDVRYIRTDQMDGCEIWEGHDLPEAVVLTIGGDTSTIWISEGNVDAVAVAGDPSEITPAFSTMPAGTRQPWPKHLGEMVRRVRTASTRESESKPRRTPRRARGEFVQAVELTFEQGSITIAGCDPELGLATTWFDGLAILDGTLEQIGDLSARAITDVAVDHGS